MLSRLISNLPEQILLPNWFWIPRILKRKKFYLSGCISETINIIQDVSVASKEQMSGIEQINDTVTMLDRVTQENAIETNNITSIATEVSIMANNLVNDAKNKKFN